MFETFQRPDAVARIRAAAIAPAIAFVVTQLYVLVYPLLARVPPLLFWCIDTIALAGAIAGTVMLVRALARHRRELELRALFWAAGVAIPIALSAWIFVSLTFPWL